MFPDLPHTTNQSHAHLPQNVVLADKPLITSTIHSLSPALLETLLTELSTLASVYHKPAETFLGQGRFGAEAMQRAAIEEQKQLARENPIAASAAAAVAGTSGGDQHAQPQSNIENLLDIDFDGGAPASLQGQSSSTGGFADLMGGSNGVPSTSDSPAPPPPPPTSGSNNAMDDLMGVFGGAAGSSAPAQSQAAQTPFGGVDDLMGGFGGMDINGSTQQQTQQQKKSNEDILGLF